MSKNTFEAIIDGKQITITASENAAITHKAIEIVQKQIKEIKESSFVPMKREDLYLMAAMNIAGDLIKENNRIKKYEEDFTEEVKKLDEIIDS